MAAALNGAQLAALRALCDTFVPSLREPDDPTGFWARSASDMGVPAVLAGEIENLPEPLRGGLTQVLDLLAAAGIVEASSQPQREKIVRQVAASSPPAAAGVNYFQKRTMLLNYGLPESPPPANQNAVTYGSPAAGQNPNWEVLGYPGPVTVPHDRPRNIQPVVPDGERLVLEADVCVVGSGAGGAVIASRMAEQGRRVVVLEAGGYFTASDFHQLELWGYKHLWYRGGATPTADGNVLLLAGGTLGGGTEINWMNCVRTPDLVRQDWVQRFGLDGVDSPAFDAYMDTVETRIMASTQTAFMNSQNLRMFEGCQKLGYRSTQCHVNWNPQCFQPLLAGYTGFGDQTGAKQTARRTFLRDAYRNGARILVYCRADRIVTASGRAAGVEATYADPQGRKAQVSVRAPQVVVACGALESPALLLRSGIGGPAVGQCLHVQPGGAVYGVYAEPQHGWWGSPMTANCEQFVDVSGDGYGFYMEIPAFGPGFVASVIPWSGGRQHKEVMTKVPHVSTFIWFLRDKSCGKVTIDQAGNSVANYALDDPVDQQNFRRAAVEAVRIHEAAGAREILFSLSNRQLAWKRGQSLAGFIATILRQPLLGGAQPMISAHQLSTCAMGSDPAVCVADTNGELHDVAGVWIGDASACPTALGANPMVTIMALAERTADRMSGASRRDAAALPAAASEMLGELAGMLTDPARMLRGMAGFMFNPMRVVALGGRLLQATARQAMDLASSLPPLPAGTAGARPFAHIIELECQPGQATAVVELIRDRAIPDVIRPAPGFVDEIVLLSIDDPNHVTAISFWRSQEAADHFNAHGFDQVSALLGRFLAAKPERRQFDVGASTDPEIRAELPS
ncbi:MAG TPA: GMC family oxidoreductase N-terminal domain-containing protein [Thermoanaerobaculia bacterium]|nr:GMC family oxidoreductase N-terminal domain-containing protein [Thermoanaerobaculia bacterium]